MAKGLRCPAGPQHKPPRRWQIEITAERAVEGRQSAKFSLDGRQGDGTIWLARLLTVPKARPLVVALAFQFWSPAKSDNLRAYVVAYAGKLLPVEEAEFAQKEPADKTAGWRRYQFTLPVGATEGELWVALGISVAWETFLEYFIDDVRVEVR